MIMGKRTFTENAQRILREIGMQNLHPAHGAAVDAVRWCLVVRGRPTHHRLAFLERESPALLAYLEALATSGETSAWRSLEGRIRAKAEVLRETQAGCIRPWLVAIWGCLPELAAIGQAIIDRPSERDATNSDVVPAVEVSGEHGDGDSDKGSAGKAGSTGTTAKPTPRPSSRFILPAVEVTLTEVEKRTFGLGSDETVGAPTLEGPGGMKGPGGGGRKT